MDAVAKRRPRLTEADADGGDEVRLLIRGAKDRGANGSTGMNAAGPAGTQRRHGSPREERPLWRALRWARDNPGMTSLFVLLTVIFYYNMFWNSDKPSVLASPVGSFAGSNKNCPILDRVVKPAVPLRIGLVSFAKGLDPDLIKLSADNKEMYASLHGYDIIRVDDGEIDTSRQAPWSKFLILKKALAKYDYLVWVDTDALFARMDVPIEAIIASDNYSKDLYYSQDELDINSGVFIIRNSEWTLWYLQTCWDQEWLVTSYDFRSTHEQRAIHYLHGAADVKAFALEQGKPWPYPELEQVRAHTNIVPHCALNSNICEEFWLGFLWWRRTPYAGYWCDNVYQEGHFIIHLAGKSPKFYRNWLLRLFARRIQEDNLRYIARHYRGG